MQDYAHLRGEDEVYMRMLLELIAPPPQPSGIGSGDARRNPRHSVIRMELGLDFIREQQGEEELEAVAADGMEVEEGPCPRSLAGTSIPPHCRQSESPTLGRKAALAPSWPSTTTTAPPTSCSKSEQKRPQKVGQIPTTTIP